MIVVTGTVRVIDMIMMTETTAPVPAQDRITMTIAITMIETATKGDVQMNGTEIEMTATAMTGLTDAGPGIETIMTMTDIVNVDGKMKMEIAHDILMIGTQTDEMIHLKLFTSMPSL